MMWSVKPRWRRRASKAFNDCLLRRLRDAPLLRLGLHPADAAYPEVMRFWLDVLAAGLETRTPMTKSSWLGVAV